MPKQTATKVQEVLKLWATIGIKGWSKQWLAFEEEVADKLSRLVGSLPKEVCISAGLTQNLHQLLGTFFKPSGMKRHILSLDPEFASTLQAA